MYLFFFFVIDNPANVFCLIPSPFFSPKPFKASMSEPTTVNVVLNEPAVDILFQNEELMVISKPPDMAMDGDLPLTVEKWVHTQHEYLSKPLPRQYDPKQAIPPKTLKFVHQLDSATSGVLCLAFSRDMAARVAHCFELRYTKKIYSALLLGHVPESWGQPMEAFVTQSTQPALQTICLPWSVGNDGSDVKEFKMCIGGENSKEALTLMQVNQRGSVNGCPATHVFLRPMSGRRHQLRVHSAHLGFPILGDLTYCESSEGMKCLPRLALHALELTLFDRVDINDDTCRQRSLDKRKRRRETLQLEQHETDESVTFKTQEPFEELLQLNK